MAKGSALMRACADRPRVSVVIPAYRSEAMIARCLEGIAVQTLPAFETIVVDSSPDHATERVVRGGFPDVRLERAASRLPPHAAHNRGARLARGDVIVFTDPDCRPCPEWLGRLIAAQRAGHLVVGGGIEPSGHRWLERGMHLCKFGTWLPGGRPGPRKILPTANLAWRRDVWEAVGPFRVEGWSGDTELSWRARGVGVPLRFEPDARVAHASDLGARGFWRERVERGFAFGGVRFHAQGWSRARAAAYMAGAPLIAVVVLARGFMTAWRGRQRWDAVVTLPVQILGYAAWTAGEALSYARYLRRGDPGLETPAGAGGVAPAAEPDRPRRGPG